MGVIRKSKILLNQGTTASTGNWYFLDYRFSKNFIRPLAGTLTAGDTIYIEVSPDPQYNSDGTVASVSTIVTVTAFTSASFAADLVGDWPMVRARKSGTAGSCIVKGVL